MVRLIVADDEIGRRVVGWVPIDVMDNCGASKSLAQRARGDEPVFLYTARRVGVRMVRLPDVYVSALLDEPLAKFMGALPAHHVPNDIAQRLSFHPLFLRIRDACKPSRLTTPACAKTSRLAHARNITP